MAKLVFAAVLGAGLVMGGGASAAFADTFQVNGTFQSGGSVSGTVSLDFPTSTVTSVNLLVDADGINHLVASQSGGSFQSSLGAWEIYSFYFPSGMGQLEYALDLLVPQSSVMSPTGGPVCSTTYSCGAGVLSQLTYGPSNHDLITMGSVVPTPEPESFWLLGSGALGAVAMVRRRLRS